MSEFVQFPPQQLSFSKKNKAWRQKHCDWADSKTFFNYSPVRKSVMHKKINYDLLNGILHMDDLIQIINPENIDASFIPEQIQHYALMNSKLNVLRGEEAKRIFDFKVIVTNPNAVSEIENAKKEALLQNVTALIQNTAQSEEEFNAALEKLDDYYTYEWQDMREIRANAILQHYWKELNIPIIFNAGFMDALAVAEEIYICDIVGGEPTLERLNPNKVRVFRSGYSNKIEDADVVVIEDYWSPGKIIDHFYDTLTEKDRKYIENLPNTLGQDADSMGNIDPRNEFIQNFFGEEGIATSDKFFSSEIEGNMSLLPYDVAGNIRVVRVFWKSKRKIKKVKYYDENGEEQYDFFPETYVIDKARGEEETIMWINEAWEGTKIGSDIYLNMRPRVVQYNRLSNPSRCHFGIIGSVYNLNENRPFSLVDMMKPYNYLYDAVHDRLNKLIAKNWGKIIQLDLAKVPAGWEIDKWMYYAKTNSIAVIDSFKEGNIGAATGKIAGALNNASSGVIDAELGNSIQAHIALLETIKNDMSDIVGISKQREGQIQNRETVGGIERATLQSSYITEWLFVQHDDVKKRVLECFLETAKIAMKGNTTKFQYIMADNSTKIMTIDGDEFAECDYGLVVDNSNATQQLQQKLDMLAQAALQNQTLNFSSIMKLYTSTSMAEKQRMVEKNEQALLERQQQQQQEQLQMQQEQMQRNIEIQQQQLQLQDKWKEDELATKLKIAQIGAEAEAQRYAITFGATGIEQQRADTEKQKVEGDLKAKEEELRFNKEKLQKETELKKMQIKATQAKANSNK